jgi:hypothetical protein
MVPPRPKRQFIDLPAILSALSLTGGAAHGTPDLPGEEMGWGWAIPFAGVLLSIALGPLLAPKLWHAHYGKMGAAWAAPALIALLAAFDDRELAGLT